MDVVSEAVRHLVVDLGDETGQAAEGRLDMPARAAKTVVEIDVAEGGVEVVDKDQLHDASPKPDAFGISGGTVDGLRRFDKLVGLVLVFLGGIGRIVGRGLALILGAALGKGAPDAEDHDKSGDGEMAQYRYPSLKHPTHEFPDCTVLRPRASERLV